MAQLAQDNVPFIRRQSGGGTVYHDLQNANYSLIHPRSEFALDRASALLKTALALLDIPCFIDPKRHDIWLRYPSHDGNAMNDELRKVSGSAYRIIKNHAFHHGTMLIHTPSDSVNAYLHPSSRFHCDKKVVALDNGLVSSAIQSVGAQVGRLGDFSHTVSYDLFCRALSKVFLEQIGGMRDMGDFESAQLPVEWVGDKEFEQMELAHETVGELKSWDCRYGLTPDFKHTISSSYGRLTLNIHRGIIQSVDGMDVPYLVGRKYEKENVEDALSSADSDEVKWFLKELIPQLPRHVSTIY